MNKIMPDTCHNVVFTGTKGRLEMSVREVTYVNGEGDKSLEGAAESKSIKVFPMFGKSYNVEIPDVVGGHGGGDTILLEDLFGENPPYDPLERAASYVDGAMSILTGVAANKSIASGMPIKIDDLVKF